MERIQVSGRIRPLNKKEINENENISLTSDGKKNIFVEGLYANKTFRLDQVLTQQATQPEVFSLVLPFLKVCCI